MKRIILCADDYGQNPAISQAIVALIQKKRLSAASCMTTSSFWASHSSWVLPFREQIDIGLHFNLTEGKSLTDQCPVVPLKKRVLQALSRTLDFSSIEQELQAQIDQFVASTGFLPDFIDGHQHVHQLPIVRDVLIKVYQSRFKGTQTYIRCLYNPNGFNVCDRSLFKQMILRCLGTYSFKKLLLASKIPHNASFSGIYHFSSSKKYEQLFEIFLQSSSNNGLIMCHPGIFDASMVDSIQYARPNEYAFLNSDVFLEKCRQHTVDIGRFDPKLDHNDF